MTAALEIDTWIAARPETVFGFFTDAADFGSWMGGKQAWQAQVDPRVGGEVRVDYGPAGTARGEVLAIEPPRRFAFSWGYESGQPFGPGATRVEITLAPERGGTRLVLRHEGLPSEALARAHTDGWRLYAGILGAHTARREHADRLPELVAGWLEAWNGDVHAGLARCLADDGEFRDDNAAVLGRAALAAHIANSRRFMPGVTLRALRIDQCHDLVRFGWEAVRDGQRLVAGENVAEIGPDGRFRRVHGFRDPA